MEYQVGAVFEGLAQVRRGKRRVDQQRNSGMVGDFRNQRHVQDIQTRITEDLGEQHSLFAPFFGVQKATLPVLGRMAKACNAVVLPCISCYDPKLHKYRVKMLPALKPFPSDDDHADSTAMNRAIEETILECPQQYLWTFRYFQTRPEGEAPVYRSSDYRDG